MRKLPQRDGDKKQANKLIEVDIKTGRRPHAGKIPCSKCGHLDSPGDKRRHDYHHYLGYAAKHHADVIVMCSKCHGIEHQHTHCRYGHELTPGNVYISPRNGSRHCMECRRAADRRRFGSRREASIKYLREYRKRKKQQEKPV